MNINTIFNSIFGRNINLTGVNYENAYESEDIKAAVSLMYILDKYNYNVPHNYSYEYNKKHGVIFSRDLVDDIFLQSTESEGDMQMDEELADSIQPLHLSLDPRRKATSGLISAVQYAYYSDIRKSKERRENEYYEMFPQGHPKESYELGKRVWKSIKGYEEQRQGAKTSANNEMDQSQPE